MKYICNNCGAVVDTDKLRTVREEVGEYWGSPAYDSYGVCPCCGSEDLEEGEECVCCGEVFPREEMYGNVCLDCFFEYERKWKFWYNKCEEHSEKDTVKLNIFLLYQFTPEQIEEILLKELEKREKNSTNGISCEEFMTADTDWSAEMIEEEATKGGK